MIFDPTISLGNLITSMAILASIGATCWKMAAWHIELDRDVKDGFMRNDTRHAEIRIELEKHTDLLSQHATHLAALDERTELILRRGI